MRLGGLEPPTPALGEPRSIHLSYRRKLPFKLFIERLAPSRGGVKRRRGIGAT
jgi:hypothetical protein